MANDTFLLTGSMGCIGAWVLRNLLDDGARIIATDLDTTPHRPRLLLSDNEIDGITWLTLDVTDLEACSDIVRQHKVTHIIHLAGLQIPFCRANPSLGAAVNVVGTANIFEAARHNNVTGLTYASSIGVMGPPQAYPKTPVADDVPLHATSLYGVYKAANEGTAKVFWQDWQVGSVGLRPYVVYGTGRDQGMSADPAKAILAAVAGKPFHIRFDGPIALQHARDVAQIFIASARLQHQGAPVCNLRGDVIEVSAFVDTLKQLVPDAQITYERNNPLPYPADLDDQGLQQLLGSVPHTPLEEAISEELERLSSLLKSGKIDLAQLDA